MEENKKKKYINDKISEWMKEINMLTDIVITHPQAAYTTYVTSYQHKLIYLLRTIPILWTSLRRSVRLYNIN